MGETSFLQGTTVVVGAHRLDRLKLQTFRSRGRLSVICYRDGTGSPEDPRALRHPLLPTPLGPPGVRLVSFRGPTVLLSKESRGRTCTITIVGDSTKVPSG